MVGGMVRSRVRIRFSKQGDLRLIGHRDLMRCFERLFRRAGLSLSFSEGFHPKPRMTFPLALAVGIEGLDEVMEFELAETLAADEILSRTRPQTPPGLELRSAEVLSEGSKKAKIRSVCYEATVPAAERVDLPEQLERLMSSSSCPVARGHGRTAIDVRPLLMELALADDRLQMRLRVDNSGSAGPREILAALGHDNIEQQGARFCRTAVEI
jgi:radical SAM-linked protein